MKSPFVILFICSLSTILYSSPKPELSIKGKLLFEDDYTKTRGKKPPLKLNDQWTSRAGLGLWKKKESLYQSNWKPGVGHTPVMSYQGEFKNVIVECVFRYGDMDPNIDWHTQCFRITLDNRNLYTGHILSAWANPNNDFIETGFLLQHIHKNKDKSIVSDLLLDRQPLVIKPGQWTKVILEVVDNEALFQMEDNHLAYAKLDKLNVPKINLAITLGKTWHELKSIKVWEALPNPEWKNKKTQVLSSRKDFSPQKHNYVKPALK